MLHDNRRWSAQGDRIIGTAEGRPDQVLIVIPAPLGEPDEQHLVTVAELTSLLNGLSDNEARVLDAVLAHQELHMWPAPIGQIAEATGLTRKTVHDIFDRLVELGHGTRPPQGTGGPRPFIAHTLEGAR